MRNGTGELFSKASDPPGESPMGLQDVMTPTVLLCCN